MLFLILFVISIILIVIYVCIYSNTSPFEPSVPTVVFGILSFTSCIVCIIVLFVSWSYTHSIEFNSSEKIVSNQMIVNLKYSSNVKGGFFIGTGSVGSEQYYYYYYITDTNTYKLSKLRTDDCEIVYTDSTPHIEKIVQVYTPDKQSANNCLTLDPVLAFRTPSTSGKYKIYIPEGTITTDFILDAE